MDSDRKRKTLTPGKTIGLFLGSLLLAFGLVVPASASAAVGPIYYGTVNGVSFSAQSGETSSSGYQVATTYLTRSSGTFPSGWAGSQARMYYSTGSLYTSNSMTYNGGAASTWNSSLGAGASGSFYSQGITHHWNGSGYNAAYPARSPNQSS